MDILTHTLSGLVIGSVVANFVAAKQVSIKQVLIAGALGGAFPDIDAISLWGKFDATIGKWLHLPHSGNIIYSGKYWYSHHGFFHSIAASIIAGFLIGCCVYFCRWMQKRQEPPLMFLREHSYMYLTFVLACMAHALGDMITPASAWGGVRLFWPATVYIGGWGNVWWWNNYDIFLLLCSGLLANAILLLLTNWVRFRVGVASLIATLICVGGIWFQVKNRKTDYAYEKDSGQYQQLEEKSKEEQKRILSPKLYQYMEDFDTAMPFHF